MFRSPWAPSEDRDYGWLLVLYAFIGGGLLGGICGVLFAIGKLPKLTGGELAIAVALATFIYVILGLVIGFLVGGFLLARLANAPSFRIPAAIIATLGWGVIIYLGATFNVAAQKREKRIAARNQERAEAQFKKETERNAASAAYLASATRDVPALLGNLYYPGAEIIPYKTEPNGEYACIFLRIQDSDEAVSAYYQRIQEANPDLLALQRKIEQFKGHRIPRMMVRPSDGRAVTLSKDIDSRGQEKYFIAIVHGMDRWPTFESPAERRLLEAPDWIPADAVHPDFRAGFYTSDYKGVWIQTPVAPNVNRLASMAPFEQVVAHYRSGTTPLEQTDSRYVGSVQFPRRKQMTIITVERGDTTSITLEDAQPPQTGSNP